MTETTTDRKALARRAVAAFKAADRSVGAFDRKQDRLNAERLTTEVKAILDAGDAVTVWVTATGETQGSFPVPEGCRWSSKGALSNLVNAFKHYGIDYSKAETAVVEYRGRPGRSRSSVLTAINAAHKSTAEQDVESAATKQAERDAKQAETEGKANGADTPMRSVTADEVALFLIASMDQVSDAVFGQLAAALRDSHERRDAAKRTPNAAAA